MFLFLQNRKEILIPCQYGFSHFVSHLMRRKKGVCEFVSFPLFLVLFSKSKLFAEIKFIPRFRVLGGFKLFSLNTTEFTQLDKWSLITSLFEICEALHDIPSKLSISNHFFFQKSRLRAASQVCDSLIVLCLRTHYGWAPNHHWVVDWSPCVQRNLELMDP